MKKLIACLLLMFLGTSFLSAEDFTFNVPYNTYALPPSIRIMRISCYVLDAAGNPIAIGDKDIPIGGGGDTGTRTVQIKFNAQPGKRPESGVSYKCGIYEPYNVFIPQSSTRPSRIEVTGPIPPTR